MVNPVCDLSILTGWQTIGAIAGIMSFSMIALFYMFSEITANSGLKAWSKVELGQAMLSLVILFGITAFVVPLCNISIGGFFVGGEAGAAGFGDNNFFDAATQYMSIIRDQSFSLFMNARTQLGQLEYLSTIYESKCDILCIFGLAQPVNEYPHSGELTRAAPISMTMNSAMISTLTAIFILFVLAFIKGGMFQILLPFGIMMRSLPFLRGFGGALIAISLSLFIFYPFMLVLNALLFLPLYNGLAFTDPLLTRASALFIAAVFLPSLNFVIIGAFTRELAHLFGGDVDISKLSQMI